MQILIERQVKDGNLPYELYRELIGNQEHMKQTIEAAMHNMAINLSSFGRWTLRDKAVQRRLALRQSAKAK